MRGNYVIEGSEVPKPQNSNTDLVHLVSEINENMICNFTTIKRCKKKETQQKYISCELSSQEIQTHK